MDIRPPSAYVVSRSLASLKLDEVRQLLRITPPLYGIAVTASDAQLAQQFVDHVIPADSDEYACHLAIELHRTTNSGVLVIGDAEFLDALFEDGTRKAL